MSEISTMAAPKEAVFVLSRRDDGSWGMNSRIGNTNMFREERRTFSNVIHAKHWAHYLMSGGRRRVMYLDEKGDIFEVCQKTATAVCCDKSGKFLFNVSAPDEARFLVEWDESDNYGLFEKAPHEAVFTRTERAHWSMDQLLSEARDRSHARRALQGPGIVLLDAEAKPISPDRSAP